MKLLSLLLVVPMFYTLATVFQTMNYWASVAAFITIWAASMFIAHVLVEGKP
jgi:hypothetical protein